MKTYLNKNTEFEKLPKELLAEMLSDVFQFIENERHTQSAVDLTGYLLGNSLCGTNYGVLDKDIEADYNDEFYSAERAVFQARLLLMFAKKDCGGIDKAGSLDIEDIKEMINA